MSRYVQSSSLLLFFFWLFPLVLSHLTQSQRSTMIRLAAMVNSINTSPHHWNTTDPNPCSWKGVTCSSNPISIIHLSLPGFGISGSDFLTGACKIDSLQSLDLSNNLLSSIPDGFIRDCGKINGLKMLNFNKNNLSGLLPAFNGFDGLQFLDLSYNSFVGNIGFQLDGLVGLRSLNLSTNLFNGSLPTHLGKSMVLEELQLSTNSFQGRIPEELVAYQNLTLIDLSENQLSGSVPDRIGELSNLVTIVLSSNNLNGAIPSSLSMISTLSRFAANENKFTGEIPHGISRYMKNLDLSYNSLSGLIPSDLLSQLNLRYVDLSNNLLKGPIPTNISPSLFRLRLGNNSLNGSIPSVAVSKLTYLELDNNKLSGRIPLELGSCQSLALLNLAENELTGELPIQLGNLSNLQVMKLQSNRLVGVIPDQVLQLQNLSILNMSWNSLTGSIPSSISSLYYISNFNLQGNNLSGPIPDSIGSLNSLLELQLGSNQLSGKIPRMPRKLSIALNLSSNLFEGPIPDALELSGLEVLDLSNNRFNGEIPPFLTKMASLTQLVLSNNQLSGFLPDFPQYISVKSGGNKDLRTTRTPNPTQTSSKKRHSTGVVVAISVGAAVLAVGFIAVIVVLVSRHLYRVNDENVESEEHLQLPQVITRHLITTNAIHRSRIDFTKAMEAVGNPSNITLKSKFSTYYEAVMPCGRSYYVKKLNWSDKIFQLGSNERFGQELEMLGKLSNSNVMIPLAYVLTADSAYLFYEYAERGTLFDALHRNLGNDLDWASRYSIAVGVAHGLAFLHGCTTTGPILHLDLSTKSILLKSLKEPQVGDIELCKVIDPSKSSGSLSTVAGSVGYIPPEYAYTMRVTIPGNVYSFGVVLLELLTGKQAVSGGTELAKWVLSNTTQRDRWAQILDSSAGITSIGVRSQMLSVLKIALSCVSPSPEARPKMKSVLRMLLNAR